MADFTAIKTAIQTYIKQNGNEEITGEKLQEILLSMVTTLGDSAINDLITALNDEVAARQNADGTLQQNITKEATARGNADTALGGRIDDEATARANGDTDLANRLGSTITAENTAAAQIAAEAEARGNADTALQGLINGIKQNIDNGYVYAGIATPSSTPATGKVFYLALTAGTYTNFGSTVVSQGINILKYNGSAWVLDAFIGIDDVPTPSSTGIPKSGGTFDFVMKNGSAFDISAHFASGGTLATYADLSAALTALNTLSADYKRGGMSIKFVQSSDNKYVCYFYTGTATTGSPNPFLDTANWEKTNLEEELRQLDTKINYNRNLFILNGFYSASNGTFLTHSSWKSTPKLRINREIGIRGKFYLPASATNGAMVFFKEDGTFLSAYYSSNSGFKERYIDSSEIPENAVFVGVVTLVINVEDSWVTLGEEVSYPQYIDDVLTTKLNQVKTVTDTIVNDSIIEKVEKSKEITDYIARFDNEWFSVDGIWDATGVSNFPYSPTATKSTPILPLTDDIFIRCYLGTSSKNNKYGIVFFNENKQFMSGVSIYAPTSSFGLTDIHLTSENIPTGAKYFSAPTLKATGFLDKSYVEIRLDSIYLEKLDELNQIDTHLGQIDTNLEEVNEQLIWSNALEGLVFNNSEQHQLAKQAIKAVWFSYGLFPASQKSLVDALIESLKNTKLYIQDFYNVEGTYGCFTSIYDAVSGGTLCFSKYVAGIHTITGDEEDWYMLAKADTIVWPSGSGITGYPFIIHLAIDWNVLNNKRITTRGDNNPIEIDFGKISWNRVNTETVKEKVEEIDNQVKSITSIDLTGKTIVCLGDSLTEMVDTTNNKHYSDYIAERTGGTFINIGFGGTQLRQRRAMAVDFDLLPESTEAEIAEKSRYAYATIDIINLVKAIVANDFTEQTKAVNWLANHGDDNTAILARVKTINWANVDGVTVFAGTNDWPSNSPTIGQSGSTDVNYTLGAVNEIIHLLLSTFKHLKIYWFTPVVRWIYYASGAGLDADWSDVKAYNQDNGTLRYFSEQVMKEVLINHIPCCDLYNTLGWNKFNFSNYFPSNDGTHPRTLTGVQFLAKKIGAFILANNTL